MKRPLGRFRDRKSRIRIFFPKFGHNIGGGGGFGAADFFGSGGQGCGQIADQKRNAAGGRKCCYFLFIKGNACLL